LGAGPDQRRHHRNTSKRKIESPKHLVASYEWQEHDVADREAVLKGAHRRTYYGVAASLARVANIGEKSTRIKDVSFLLPEC
jgi:hypothetical protein